MITQLDYLKQMAGGEEISLPPFKEGTEFVVRLRRPSMLALCKSGRIPNLLLGSASKMFMGKTSEDETDMDLVEMFGVMEALCSAAFVEPTYKQLQDEGIELTDEQFMAVFNYTQQGIRGLSSFRTEQENFGHPGDIEATQQETI